MDKPNFPYWMAVGESELVKFSELAHLIAKALHPGDDEIHSYGAARVNLDDELRREVEAGRLVVRNAASLGQHKFPYGDALSRAVLMPHDLTQFLADRGIELRLRPHGSGPALWTLSNAAAAVAEQEGWHDGARAGFLDSIMEAASTSALKVRDPRTDLVTRPRIIRSDWELVSVNDLNAWLAGQDAPYRWNVTELTPYQKWEVTRQEADIEQAKPDYQAKLARAYELHAELEAWGAMKHQNDPDKYEKIVSKIARIKSELAALNASREPTGATPPALDDGPILRRQETTIMSWLRENGYDPKNLPKVKNGSPTAKAHARAALKGNGLFAGSTTFEKAWERLRGFEDIGESKAPVETLPPSESR